MAENDIGSLVVLRPEGQHIAGIVTERGRCFLPIFSPNDRVKTYLFKL